MIGKYSRGREQQNGKLARVRADDIRADFSVVSING